MEQHKGQDNISERHELCIMGVKTCAVLLGTFVTVFLTAQIFIVSDQNVVTTALFITMYLVSFFVFHLLSSFLARPLSPVRLIQISSILCFLFLLVITLWPELVETHAVFLGIAWGLARGFYWSGIEYIVATSFKGSRTLKFELLYRKLKLVAGILFPVTLGLIINFGDFTYTIMAILFVCVAQVAFSFGLKKQEEVENRGVCFKQFFQNISQKNISKQAWGLWIVALFRGTKSVLNMSIPILIIVAYGTHLNLGILMSVISLLSIILIFVYRRAPLRIQAKIYFALAILLFLSSVPLFFLVSYVTVAAYQFFVKTNSIIDSEYGAAYANFAKTCCGEQFTLASHSFLTAGHTVGRVVMCVALIGAGLIGGMYALVAAIFLMTVSSLVTALLLWRWKKKYIFTTEMSQDEVNSCYCECKGGCLC